ncbi:MAG: hypothetical protein H6Q25_260 [Bacteroidetes bacterium]|nr:hypothetical protein [Bacteroidota bacterium]
MMKKTFFLVLLLVAVSFFNSCETEDPIVLDFQSMTLDDFQVDNHFNVILEELNEMSTAFLQITNYPVYVGRTTGTTLNDDGTSTVTLNYLNFVNPNSIYQYPISGTMEILITPTNFVRKVTFSNFSVNGKLVSGNLELTRSSNSDQIKFTNWKLTFTDQKFITRNGTRTLTSIESSGTPFIWDDIYEISGSLTGVNKQGYNYTLSTTTPLEKLTTYKHYVSGKAKLVVEEQNAIIDFGTGTSDSLINITIGEEIFPGIVLRD